jgi:peroxiredoxin Q/BCP
MINTLYKYGRKPVLDEITEGAKAPQFILPSSAGGNVSLKDFRGKMNVVLYFYPKDMTAGCIREACGFRDLKSEFENAGAVILGVSVDDMESHREFALAYHLDFPLLSDPDAEASTRYGVYVEKGRYGRQFMGIERTTFIIDKAGTIRRIYRNVKVDEHADEVLEFVVSLG